MTHEQSNPLESLYMAEHELDQALLKIPEGEAKQYCESALKHIKEISQEPLPVTREIQDEYDIGDKVQILDWEIEWSMDFKQAVWIFSKWLGGNLLTVTDAVYFKDIDQIYVTFEEDPLRLWYPAKNFALITKDRKSK